jgi:hypothetical protein
MTKQRGLTSCFCRLGACLSGALPKVSWCLTCTVIVSPSALRTDLPFLLNHASDLLPTPHRFANSCNITLVVDSPPAQRTVTLAFFFLVGKKETWFFCDQLRIGGIDVATDYQAVASDTCNPATRKRQTLCKPALQSATFLKRHPSPTRFKSLSCLSRA